MKNAEDRASFIESLWPYAVAANGKSPAHAQLAKERIMIAPADKLFLRAGKGTVQRGATVKIFEHEIEELYEQTEGEPILNLPKINLDQESTALQQSLLGFIDMVTSLRLVAPDQGFFSAGMDSLQVMKLAKHLKSALVENAVPRDKINTRIIYTNPSLATLADTLKTLRYGVNGFIEGIGLTGTRESKMNEMLLKYLNDLPVSTDKKPNSSQESITVILRGSSGSLGSYLLHALASCPKVARIYCLNRKANAEHVQAKTNSQRGLISSWGTKIVFLQVDLSKNDLGLSKEIYSNLLKETSVVIRKLFDAWTDVCKIS
jgi:aryl carrier-like protein